MTDTIMNDARSRLQQAFSVLAAGQFDEARRKFSQLCGETEVSCDAYRGMAAANWRLGQGDAAIEFLRKAIEISPDSVEAHADLALVLMMSARGPEAVPEWEKVLELRPDDADVWHNYAKLLGDLKQLEPARTAFERALNLQPDRMPTLCAYGRMLNACGDPDAAEVVWRKVLQLAPAEADGYQGLAETQFSRGRIEEALGIYQRGVAAVPQSPDLHMALAQVQEDLADREGAEASFRRALELRPGWPFALEGLLTLLRAKSDDKLIEQARAVVGNMQLPPADRANVGFGLGKALDAKDRLDEAMGVWRQANAARREQVGGYNMQALRERVDRSIAAFTPENLAHLAGQGNPDERPVFVLGMPRSGTSLVEQIIAAHPAATGFGELSDISNIARAMPQRVGSIQRWPEALPALTGEALSKAGEDYLREIAKRQPATETLRWVDKAPLNFFHVGLIALMFPNAHVIWCRRDPRDICTSIYGENFALQQAFATDLTDLGLFYREHMRLMRHWMSVLGERIYECSYEALVADPEPQTRALIDYVGLPWDDACLRFYEQDRPVLTPSRWQVRQPFYSKAVGRWRRYEQWLGPLLMALGDEVPA